MEAQDDGQSLGDPMTYLLAQYREQGPVFRVERDGKPATVLAGPDANMFIARPGQKYLSSEAYWTAFANEFGLRRYGRDGEANRRRRRLLAPAYSRTAVLESVPRMAEIAQEIVGAWAPGHHVAVVPELQRITAEQLGRLMINFSPGPHLSDLIVFLHTALTATVARTQPTIALSDPGYLGAKERALGLARSILAAHRGVPGGDRPPDVLDGILAAAAESDDGELTEEFLEFMALGPLLAGIPTVAYRCAFMLYLLLRDPRAQDRVITEVREALTTGPLTWSKLRLMPALHGAAFESLRLYPTPQSEAYTVVTPFTFVGRPLEAGDEVLVPFTMPHWLPSLFPEPRSLDLDRYAAPRHEHRQPGAFAPFGLGMHNCLGSGIAEIQIMVIVGTILDALDLEIEPPDYAFPPYMEVDPSRQSGLQLRVAGRRR